MTAPIAELRRALAVAALALAALAGPASGQTTLKPSISPFAPFAAPTGIAEYDFNAGTSVDFASGVAVHGERIYTVGLSGGNPTMGIVARRLDGTFDNAFSGDGRQTIDIAAGSQRDHASAIAVLPDGRLRIVGATDVDTGTQTSQVNLDVAIVGLNPDGSFDQTFGGGDGIVTFPVGTGNDVGTRLELDAAGRIAVTGCVISGTSATTCESGLQDFFVSLRNADGSPAAFDGADGVRTFNRGGVAGQNISLVDRGVDVAFRPGGGLVALLQVETNPDAVLTGWRSVLHAFKEDGSDETAFSEDGDLDLPVGPPDVFAGGLMVHNGRLWVTGQVRGGDNGEAYLARLNADGGDFQFRTFDIRGGVIPENFAVTTQGNDLTIVPGDVPTLLIGGFTTLQNTTSWSAAAFRDFEAADLAAAVIGDHVFAMPRNASNTEQQGQIMAVAGGGADWAAIGGWVRDASIADTSFGTARALIDADKACDLALEITRPLEVEFLGGRPTTVDIRVTNAGTKACAGTVSATGAYRLGTPGPDGVLAPLPTGLLAPGAAATFNGVALSYTGPRRRDDTVTFQLTAPADSAANNNVRVLRVLFRFCDVGISRSGARGVMPSEGTRRFSFTVRNVGTTTCRGVRMSVAGEGRGTGTGTFTLAGGVSATEVLRARLVRGAGTRARIEFRGSAIDDLEAANGRVVLDLPVVRVGDSDIRSVTRRGVSGKASGGRGGGLSRRQLRVSRVEVAIVVRSGKRCRWLTSRGTRTRSCARPAWMRARGTKRWRLARRLPRGRYVVMSRAVIRAGYAEANFSSRDRNRRTVRLP